MKKNVADPLNCINLNNICADMNDLAGLSQSIKMDKYYLQDINGNSPAIIFSKNYNLKGIELLFDLLEDNQTEILDLFMI